MTRRVALDIKQKLSGLRRTVLAKDKATVTAACVFASSAAQRQHRLAVVRQPTVTDRASRSSRSDGIDIVMTQDALRAQIAPMLARLQYPARC